MAVSMRASSAKFVARRAAVSRVRSVVVRANVEEPTPAAPVAAEPIVLPSGSDVKPQTLSSAMAFAGPAPEIINGR